MLFDFDKFTAITASVFPGGTYCLEETLDVFRYYFEVYENHTGRPHPPIRTGQIVRMIRIMPYLYEDSIGGEYVEIEPKNYPAIIDRHFRTQYRNCDYNINHFFSGCIRELRYYETMYRERRHTDA